MGVTEVLTPGRAAGVERLWPLAAVLLRQKVERLLEAHGRRAGIAALGAKHHGREQPDAHHVSPQSVGVAVAGIDDGLAGLVPVKLEAPLRAQLVARLF